MNRYMSITFALCVLFASIFTRSSFAQYPASQYRLTLQSYTPVMTSDVVNTNTVYYTPYGGDGWSFPGNGNATTVPTLIGGQFILYLTSTQNPQGNIYDVFLSDVTGGWALCTGPAWASLTSRGSGSGSTAIQLQKNGLWMNANGGWSCYNDGINEGTISSANTVLYVGSVYTTGNGETSVALHPNAATGGSANVIGLYNAYNRVPAHAISRDSNSSWTYTNYTFQPTDDSDLNRITWLDGLAQTIVKGACAVRAAVATSNHAIYIGVDEDSSVATPAVFGGMFPVSGGSFFLQSPGDTFYPQYGLHYIQGMEAADGSVTATFYGAGVTQSVAWDGEI